MDVASEYGTEGRMASSLSEGERAIQLVSRFDKIAIEHVKMGARSPDKIQQFKNNGFSTYVAPMVAGSKNVKRDNDLSAYITRVIPNDKSIAIAGALYMPIKEELIEEELMQAFDYNEYIKAYPQNSDRLDFRLSKELSVNGRLRLNNLAATVLHMRGMSENPFAQRFAWWVNIEHRGLVPVRQEQGDITVAKDTLAPTRYQMLLNGALIFEMHNLAKRRRIWTVYIELFEWLFLNPLARTKQLKAWLTLVNQSAFAMSTSGKWTSYGRVATGRTLFSKSSVNVSRANSMTPDAGYWTIASPYYKDMNNETLEEKLLLFTNWSKALVTAQISVANLSDLHLLNTLVGLSGYAGTDAAATFVTDFDPNEPNMDRPMDEYLYTEFKKIWDTARKNKLIPTPGQFAAAVPSILTSKSAGVEKASLQVKTRLAKAGSDDLLISGKSKALVVLLRPEEARLEKVRSYTEDNPGTLGTRNVPGLRATRAIFSLTVANFVWEYLLQETMYRVMSIRDKSNDPVGNSSYSFTHATGIADHISEIVASADEYSLGVFADYSEFDKTFKSHKRDILVKAYEDWCDEALVTGTSYGTVDLGVIPDMRNYLRMIWGDRKRKNAAFAYKYVDETRVFATDRLLSGEFVTSLLGSFVNRTMFLSYLSRVDSDSTPTARKVSLLYAEFMGDDVKSQYSLTNPSQERDLTPYLVNTFAENADANQTSINILKSFSRKHSGDYLRNRTFFGIFMPGAITQTLGSEKGRTDEDVISIMSGWVSIVQLNVQRGWNPDKATDFVYTTWNLIRSSKTVIPGTRYYLPFALIWAPRSMGGVGFVHNNWLGASRDSYIYHLMLNDPVFDELIRTAAGVFASDKSSPVKDDLLSAINNGDITPVNALEKGKSFVLNSLDKPALKQMPIIREKLAEEGLPPLGDLAYDRLHVSIIEKAISGTQAFKDAIGRDFMIRASKAMLAASTNKISLASIPKGVGVFAQINYELTDYLESWCDIQTPTNPFSLCRGPLANLTTYYGLNSGENHIFRVEDQLARRLKQSSTMRRDVEVSTVLDILRAPGYYGNVQNMALFFAGLGATYPEAVSLANDFASSAISHSLYAATKGTSFNDQMLPLIDFSNENVDRIVDVPALPDMISRAVVTYGMMISLCHFSRTGEARRVRVTLKPGQENELYSAITNNNLPLTKYLPGYIFDGLADIPRTR
jgi:hypothetical protein